MDWKPISTLTWQSSKKQYSDSIQPRSANFSISISCSCSCSCSWQLTSGCLWHNRLPLWSWPLQATWCNINAQFCDRHNVHVHKSMHISTVYKPENAPFVLFLLLLLVSSTHCHLQWGGSSMPMAHFLTNHVANYIKHTKGELKTHLVSNIYPTRIYQKTSSIQPKYTNHHKSKCQNSFSPVVSFPFQTISCPKHLFCFSWNTHEPFQLC